MEAIHYALGDYDVVLIVDMPDAVSGAALGLRVSASRLVRTEKRRRCSPSKKRIARWASQLTIARLAGSKADAHQWRG